MPQIGSYPGIHNQEVQPKAVPTGDNRKKKGAWRCTTCATIISRIQYYAANSMCAGCREDQRLFINRTTGERHDQTFPDQRILLDVSEQMRKYGLLA